MRKRSIGINVRVTVTEKKKGDDVGEKVRLVTLRVFTPEGAGIRTGRASAHGGV